MVAASWPILEIETGQNQTKPFGSDQRSSLSTVQRWLWASTTLSLAIYKDEITHMCWLDMWWSDLPPLTATKSTAATLYVYFVEEHKG